ncbi:MAG TPA: serine hydrolase [Gemmataceae bacterium]|nr:serine hydrolase [Gemmataceae bacterium]
MRYRLLTLQRLVPVFALLLSGWFPVARAAEHVEPPKEYQAAVRALEEYIAEQVRDKRLPALSIALIDDQKIVWARGFGFADPKAKKPATAETVYRVGSVSKLFTDIAVMRLVEQGQLDLDAPVTKYLPDFKPANPFDKAITLRQLMTHRSGLVRESPVGNYFDPTSPTLAQTVASLNQTKLVYPPESRIKYSNAAIATVGLVLEKTQKKPFVAYLKETLLEPLGMKRSAFEATPELKKDLASAVMWTYQGREFPAPTFELGMAPAGSMYATVLDLGRFLGVLFNGGMGPKERLLKKETIEAMWKPQFPKKGDKEGFGIGFHIDDFRGKRRIGHGGAIYGFATDLSALPDEKLGVVVVTSRDVANGLMTHIADLALEQMLAVRQKKPLPKIERTSPVDHDEALRLTGRYRSDDRRLELWESAGRLFLLPANPGMRFEVRKLGDGYITDDPMGVGVKLKLDGEKLRLREKTCERLADEKPEPLPSKWAGLIGEYGWDHNTLYILEKGGKLHALIEWVFLYPLEEESADVYKFPDFGLYHGEKLIFTRDRRGRATKVEAASVVFERRRVDGEDGRTFRIEARRSVDALRKEALAARPPRERGEFNKPDLVELTKLDATIKLDVRYATTDNFLGAPLYRSAKAFLQRPAAEALVRVHKKLKEKGYGLMVHDGYRPWYVTKIFWDATPDRFHNFVADPMEGSRHNRGCAVDLTLYDLKTGKAIEMPGGYDEMSDRSYADFPGGTSLQRWHRELLRRAMEAEGFAVYSDEWWHFDFREWKKYPTSNLTFEEVDALIREREKKLK